MCSQAEVRLLSVTRSFLDEILLHADGVEQLGPRLFSAIPAEARSAPYDRKAALYDAVVGRSVYHRVFWGTSARAFTHFARAAINAADGHWFAEVGCGSLLFTHAHYRDVDAPPTVLVDRSLPMLQRGARRLGTDLRETPGNPALLHADVATMPVRAGVFRSTLSLNLLHVPCDAVAIARELGRMLQSARGRLFLSCLVRSGRWSDAYLRFLHHVGELRRPWTLEELERTIAGGWGVVESRRVEGNVCFMVIRHGGMDAAP